MGSWEWNPATGALVWSDEMFRIFGRDRQTFIPTAESVAELLVQEQIPEWSEVVEEANNTDGQFDHHVKTTRPDGSVRLIHAIGRATFDDEGNIVRYVGTCQDVTERKKLEEKVRHQAFHDSLTGLANRDLFLDRLEHARARQERSTYSIGVLFVDLDEFKTVNDTNGHRVGDELLVEVSRRIAAELRPADTVVSSRGRRVRGPPGGGRGCFRSNVGRRADRAGPGRRSLPRLGGAYGGEHRGRRGRCDGHAYAGRDTQRFRHRDVRGEEER